MILLTGADVVLPDRVLPRASVLVEGDRIVAIEPGPVDPPPSATTVNIAGSWLVPGFVDVHVHGVEDHDVLDGPGSIGRVASRLPRYGVTAFCPTSIACEPAVLRAFLSDHNYAATSATNAARILPAHLESNFINPEYAGAQPTACLRSPKAASPTGDAGDATARDIRSIIREFQTAVGIVTVAPELEGGLDLVRELTAAGHVVSIGHSGATYDQACRAIAAGVRHATHLFNRMTPMTHRAPGAPGAVLEADAVRVEVICDGHHVHPSLVQFVARAKGPGGMMAITDGTAGSGLPPGSRTRLGGRPILVTDKTATLDDGTLAGSVLTMDAAFRMLVERVRVPIVDAARMAATTPADQLGLSECGRIAVGAVADLAVLDGSLRVTHTFLRGAPWRNPGDTADV